MPQSVQSYSIAWSDHFIHRVERLLREVHVAVGELYDEKAYPRRVALKVLKSSEKCPATAGGGLLPKEKHDGSLHSPEGTTMDVISSAGSFMLRTSVHRTPFEDNHTTTGIGIDVVLTIPEQVCSEEDLRDGRYLLCRDAFLHEVLEHLKKVQQRGTAAVATDGRKHNECEEEEEEEGKQKSLESAPRVRGVNPEKEKEGNHSRSAQSDEKNHTYRGRTAYASVGVPPHFARMEISVLPIHDCYGCHEKKIIRLRWHRRGSEIAQSSTSSFVDANDYSNLHPPTKSPLLTDSSSSSASSLYETVYVDIHFRPAMHSARVTGVKAIHKHPLYSYLVLEDYWMPVFLEKLHRLCVDSPGLRRTIVLLKCWALHLGLHAPSTGNAEGLNGFLISAMVLYLLEEEGILNAGMSEETASRAVLMYISSGGFTKSPNSTEKGQIKLPTPEENGEVAVMRFAGDALNLLFRSSAAFFKQVVERAAQESLTYTKISELFISVPFCPLAFRHDLCLTLHHCPSPPHWNLTEVSSQKMRRNADGEEEEGRETDKRESSSRRNLDAEGVKSIPIVEGVMQARQYFSLSVSSAHHIAQMSMTALHSRAEGVTVWPIGDSTLQIAVLLNNSADGRRRLTKGPPVEDEDAVKAFNAFWGAEKTSTRQFADGAIYRCVLWDFPDYLPVEHMTRLVLRYALRRHLGCVDHSPSLPSLLLHTTEENKKGQNRKEVEVEVILGGLEGFLSERVGGGEWKDVQPLVKKSLWEACKCVREVIAHLPDSALPCKILEFDFISASERCTEVFPVRPHLALTCASNTLSLRDALKQNGSENDKEEVHRNDSPPSQDIPPVFPSLTLLSSKATIEPIHCVLTIDDNRRIPDNLEAIQLMKAAIGAQLSKVLQAIYGSSEEKKRKDEDNENNEKETTVRKSNDGKSNHSTNRGSLKKSVEKVESHTLSAVSKSSSPLIYTSCQPHGVDIICHGFLFRVYVAHYREVSLLRALQMSTQADVLERKLFWAAQHAKFIRSIVYGHASFSIAVRLAKRWISAMCLYEFILPEAVELLVAHAYLKSHVASYQSSHQGNTGVGSLLSPPRTALAGFMRFMELLSTHNWETPLVLPSTDMAMDIGGTETQSALRESSRGHPSASSTAAAQALWREEQQKSQAGSSCAMFIAAPYAPTQSPFTTDTPRKMVLHRLVALSKAAFSLLLHHVCRPIKAKENQSIISAHSFPEASSAYSPPFTTSEKPVFGRTEAALFHPSLSAFDLALCFHPKALLHHDRMTTVPFEEAAAEVEVERVWQLDELGQAERMQYLMRRVERDPAGQTVRLVRQALRDKAMAFYDALAPSSALFLVALQEDPPAPKVMVQIAGEAIQAAHGAILSSPVVFLRCSSSASPPHRFLSSFLSSEDREHQKKKEIKAENCLIAGVPQDSCLPTKKKMLKERITKKDKNSKKKIMMDVSPNEDLKEIVIKKDKRINESQSANSSPFAVPQKRARDSKTLKEEEVQHKQKEKKM